MINFVKTRFEHSNVRVLLFKDNGEFVAHALEFDLVATGKSEQKAKQELLKTIETQIRFAIANSCPEIILHRAPEEDFKKWEDANNSELLDIIAEVVQPRKNTTSRPRKDVKALEFQLNEVFA